MEKSLVRQFSAQGNAFLLNTTKSGLIRTSKDQTDLGKSRIQNLPSYRRDDLSKRVEMVVIFQAIQIQRLSVEIQSLRVQLKDSQRQLKNYLSYQIQIKELNEQCLQLQQQAQNYKQEIQKMNLICQKLYSELDEKHRKYNHADLGLNKKLQESKKLNLNLEKQLAELKKLSAEQKQSITQNNQKLNKKLSIQQDQIKKLSQKLKQSQNHGNQELISQIGRLKKSQLQLSHKHGLLIKQIEEKCKMMNNLKTIVRDKMNQNQRQKSRQKNLETNFTIKLSELQNIVKIYQAKLNDQLQALTKQLEMSQNKLSIKQEELNQANQRIGSFERQVSALLDRLSQDKQAITNKLMSVLKQMDTKTQQLQQAKNVVGGLTKHQQKLITQNQNLSQSFKSTIDQVERLYQELDRQKGLNFQSRAKIEELTYVIKKLQGDRIIKEKQLRTNQNQLLQMKSIKLRLEGQLDGLNIKLATEERKVIEMQKAHSENMIRLKKYYQNQIQTVQKKLQNEIEKAKRSFELKSRQNSALLEQITQLRQSSQAQSLSVTQLLKNLETSEKLLKQAKQQQQKALKKNGQKVKTTLAKTSQMFQMYQSWFGKIAQMQNAISSLEDQNLKLDSQNKLLNFEIVQTHKINSMHKRQLSDQFRRDSRSSTDTSSLKSFVNSNSGIPQNNQKNSFLRKNHKDSIMSETSQNSLSQHRRVFSPLHNRL